MRARLDISVTLALAATVLFWERRDLPAVFLAGFLAFTLYHVALNYGEVTVFAGSARLMIVNTIGGDRIRDSEIQDEEPEWRQVSAPGE